MTTIPQDFNFNVMDSQRAKQKRLVEPQLDVEFYNQNIKITESQPKIMSSQNNQKVSGSLPLNGDAYNLSNAAHPTVCIMTFAFKLAAFVMYLLVGSFISNILTFIFVVVLSALDFWVVKNVSGRLLVGLRWNSAYDNDGKEFWKYQSYDHQFKSNSVDKMFFWASQLLFTVIWGIFLLLNILTVSFFWALLLFITCGLCGTNLYGYYQCHGQHKKKLQGLKKQYGKKVFQSIAQRVL